MKLKITIIGVLAVGGLFASSAGQANAQPVDCEAARCTIQAAIDAECSCAEAKNHGRYTSCVARIVNRSVREGLVPKKCRNKINACAIRSTCGKREGSVSCDFPGDGVSGRCRPLTSDTQCTNRGGTVVASCCETCGAPEPTATPEEPIATATPEGPVATATPEEPVATATAEEPVATATAGAEPTATPETPEPTATPEEPVATSTEGPVATATPEEPVGTATEGPIATATPEEPVATATEGPVATVTEGPVATATPETPEPTATPEGPVVTATIEPTPEATSTPSGASCGDNQVTGSEACDPPGSSTCPNAGNGLEICSMGCTCACPSRVSFTGDATDPTSILDTGWTGIAHRAPIITNGDVTVAADCPQTGSRPCGTCPISGPIPNTLPGQHKNQRCTNDTSIQCTDDSACTGGTCEFFFGSNLPLAAGGVTTCVVNQFNGPLTGTVNIETGESTTTALLTARVFNGIAIDNPCPRCVGDTTLNDGVQGGTCDGGARGTAPCDGNGTIPARPDFGTTSLDCPPAANAAIATLPIDLSSATDPVVKTLNGDSPTCSGDAGERCLCDTCNNLAATPCDSNADCTAVGATICGGRRCLGGTNVGAPCSSATSCPGGGLCNKPGEPTKPTACLDDTGTPGVLDCVDTDGDGEGACTVGPVDATCSAASGHGQRGCITDADCGGAAGSCVSSNRLCFLTGGFVNKIGTNNLTAVGLEDPPMNDVSHPTLAAVFCVGPTGLSSVNNVAGLPGPGRVTILGTALGLP